MGSTSKRILAAVAGMALVALACAIISLMPPAHAEDLTPSISTEMSQDGSNRLANGALVGWNGWEYIASEGADPVKVNFVEDEDGGGSWYALDLDGIDGKTTGKVSKDDVGKTVVKVSDGTSHMIDTVTYTGLNTTTEYTLVGNLMAKFAAGAYGYVLDIEPAADDPATQEDDPAATDPADGEEGDGTGDEAGDGDGADKDATAPVVTYYDPVSEKVYTRPLADGNAEPTELEGFAVVLGDDKVPENAVTARVIFTPEQSDGTIQVPFESFDVAGAWNWTFVAFERLYSDGSDAPNEGDGNENANGNAAANNTTNTGTNTGTNTETPGTNTETPGTNTETPGTNTETPGTNTETPGTNTETPGTNTETPGTNTEPPAEGGDEQGPSDEEGGAEDWEGPAPEPESTVSLLADEPNIDAYYFPVPLAGDGLTAALAAWQESVNGGLKAKGTMADLQHTLEIYTDPAYAEGGDKAGELDGKNALYIQAGDARLEGLEAGHVVIWKNADGTHPVDAYVQSVATTTTDPADETTTWHTYTLALFPMGEYSTGNDDVVIAFKGAQAGQHIGNYGYAKKDDGTTLEFVLTGIYTNGTDRQYTYNLYDFANGKYTTVTLGAPITNVIGNRYCDDAYRDGWTATTESKELTWDATIANGLGDGNGPADEPGTDPGDEPGDDPGDGDDEPKIGLVATHEDLEDVPQTIYFTPAEVALAAADASNNGNNGNGGNYGSGGYGSGGGFMSQMGDALRGIALLGAAAAIGTGVYYRRRYGV